ncbi:MAG: NAD-dependent epimerase/dehydratase family protein [Chloroflexi bacterium]|nr:NAD-dependent epimerase/dehydratase family protein [Chloroflexota bacterium]MCC6896019.1 NAD-dependent epimerase/dehydratase family protein [Anaerolineae bacterium]
MNILIIGGTRNVGHFLAQELLNAGHTITLLNRGKTPDTLPDHIERLRADRTDPAQLEAALTGREFDVVIDNALYKQQEAETIVRLLNGRVGHYIFLSSGQVYLVREGLERPFSEDSYEGRLIPPPKANTFAYEEWLYGIDKRKAEDVLMAAKDFPFTCLRLPMVNGERDHFSRLYSYVLRLKDGGPILVPETPDYALRHIYSQDVVKAILLAMQQPAKGRAHNISQDETTTLGEFLGIVGDLLGVQPHLISIRRSLLEANGFLPDCSPFSERWMSELTNDRSKAELGMTYTPLREYLGKIIAHYEANPPRDPVGYKRRHREIQFAEASPAK